MMEQGFVVVEELRVHGPAAVRVPKLLAEDIRLQLGHCVTEEELFPAFFVGDHVTEAFILRGQGPVHRRDRRGKPPLLDGPSLGAQGVVIVGMQPQSSPGDAEPPWNEVGRHAKYPPAFLERLADL